MRILPRFVSLSSSAQLTLVLAVWVGLSLTGPAHAGVAVGDRAPDFLLYGAGPAAGTESGDETGVIYRLSEHLGKRGVVLAFFPKAFTPG